MDCSGSGQGQVAGCCERDNEPSGFIKLGIF
jgi:L-asparaginase II